MGPSPPRVRARSTNPNLSAVIQGGWVFRTVLNGIDPGITGFVPGFRSCTCTPVLHGTQKQKQNFAHFPLNIIETGVW